MSAPDYKKLFADCIDDLERPLPKPCHATRQCWMCGGCPRCFREFLQTGAGGNYRTKAAAKLTRSAKSSG